MPPSKLDKLKIDLLSEQGAFAALVEAPNTLERNVRLSDHRKEIARIQKLLEKEALTSNN